MSKRLSALWFWPLLLVISGTGMPAIGTAWAQRGTPIRVVVTVEAHSLIVPWGEHTSEIEKNLAIHIAKSLSDSFPHWDFRHDVTKAKAYTTLQVRLHEPENSKIVMAMDRIPRNSNKRRLMWEDVWLQPTDIGNGRRPRHTRATDRLRGTFLQLFNSARQQIVRDWLSDVPLGAGGHWTGRNQLETLRIVTSLNWSRFGVLERSRLKVSCKQSGEEIEIYSVGTEDPLSFVRSASETYEALVLKPESVAGDPLTQFGLARLVEFDIRHIFLLEEREPVDDDFFAF